MSLAAVNPATHGTVMMIPSTMGTMETMGTMKMMTPLAVTPMELGVLPPMMELVSGDAMVVMRVLMMEGTAMDLLDRRWKLLPRSS